MSVPIRCEILPKYLRSVIKWHDTQAIRCTPAPLGVIKGNRADASFAAGLIIEKFAHHLPLYHQH